MDGIVVGADETAAGIAAARWALEGGALRGVPVTVVRVWADPIALGYGTGMAVLETTSRPSAAPRRTAPATCCARPAARPAARQ